MIDSAKTIVTSLIAVQTTNRVVNHHMKNKHSKAFVNAKETKIDLVQHKRILQTIPRDQSNACVMCVSPAPQTSKIRDLDSRLFFSVLSPHFFPTFESRVQNSQTESNLQTDFFFLLASHLQFSCTTGDNCTPLRYQTIVQTIKDIKQTTNKRSQ